MKIKGTSFIAVLLLLTVNARSQSVSLPELLRIPYVSQGEKQTREFLLYLPYGFRSGSPDRKWPVIFFLHGNGERGNGTTELDFAMKEGPLYEAWVQKRDLPFIIVNPQLPMHGMDSIHAYIRDRDPSQLQQRLQAGVPPRPTEFDTPQPMGGEEASTSFPFVMAPMGWETEEDDLIIMLDMVIKSYQGNADQVYLTGLSYGGMGTWYMASKYAEKWAAIAPIVGWGHPDLMEPIARAKLPVWAFAGGRDSVVKQKYFYPGLNRLEELGHQDIRFTIEADMGHDAWRRIYAGNDLYEWFLKNKRNTK